MKAIFNREFKSYFTSMIGPVFVAALVLVTGIYFMVYNMSYGYPYFAYTLSASAIVFVLTVPLLTMRSFSEERHSKTDQLLLTSPVSVTQIVLGKFFSMTAVVAIPCVIFCLCPLIIKSTGTAYFLVDYSTILVYFLIGCCLCCHWNADLSNDRECHHRGSWNDHYTAFDQFVKWSFPICAKYSNCLFDRLSDSFSSSLRHCLCNDKEQCSYVWSFDRWSSSFNHSLRCKASSF